MIKVNLLPQRRAKHKAAASDPSSKQLFVGIAALLAAGAAVFVAVDMPKRGRLADIERANTQLKDQIKQKNDALKGYADMKKAVDEANKRADAIDRLNGNKVVPAHVLHELSRILTREGPTMSEEMTRKAGNGPDADPNKRFQADWDPAHVWVLSFIDSSGSFKMDGGAQSESDVTQLAKRLQASVYFSDVSPAGGERVADRASGVEYYRFTITGKVAY
ncbi:MAG: PilN domain-containing protein [Kofleriaceae bacterium]